LGKVASLKGTVAEGVDAKLCYLGDVVSDTKMVVAGLRYPEVGEQGIFFVKEMNDMHAISPLQRWNQGHFSIKDEKPGGLIVASSTGRAICAGGMKGKVRNADPDSVQDLNLEEAGKACQKLTVSAFIKIIKSCGGDKP
jgi:hypothetical protein